MAKQSSIIRIEGTLGGISFYKTRNGYLAREKGGVDKARIESDPAFQRTRENGAEFGAAGIAGRIIRAAFNPVLKQSKDASRVRRLTRELIKVIHSDAVNARGERNVQQGNLQLLEGFEFNQNSTLRTIVKVPYRATIDRESGSAKVEVDAFVPQERITAPSGATHFRLLSGGTAIDFEKGEFQTAVSTSDAIELGVQEEAAVSMTNALPAGSTLPLLLVFGVEFLQQVNNVFYPLKNGAHNAVTIVCINVPVAG